MARLITCHSCQSAALTRTERSDSLSSVRPQLGIRLTTLGADSPSHWRRVLDQARTAETAGADVVVSGDHVVFGEDLDAYARPEVGGRPDHKLEVGPEAAFPEPTIGMAAIAAATDRVRIMNSLMLVALRRPIVLAKAMVTLDTLSAGRIDLAVGVGWQREEYEAAGLPFERRGRLLDHTLEVCEALWRETRADYVSPNLPSTRSTCDRSRGSAVACRSG